MSESLNQASHLQGSEGFHTPSARVYISYDSANPPSHPGANWTRFVCISDTHSHTFSVPSGDVLLHSGDLSRLGREDEIGVTIEWLRSLDHGVKMYAAHFLIA
jgi:hypothetical protein